MQSIVIKNFKCFNNISIPLNSLTILAGANGNGKSAVIQSFLLLRRTIEHCAKWDGTFYRYKKADGILNVGLNDSYCLSLGTSNDIVPKDSSETDVKFEFHDEKNKIQISYTTGEGGELFIKPIYVSNEIEESNCPLFWQEFYYLNAERIGPRCNNSVKFQDYKSVGWMGEFSAQVLGDTEFTETFKVDELRREVAVLSSPKLLTQVNAWFDYILPGVSVDAVFQKELLSAQIRMSNQYCKGQAILSTNIGFGISYILPIIITGLIAKKGSIMIVENPEAHLHPSAQSRIGRFFARIAEAGVNVIMETHSDHIINGIQIAIAKGEIINNKVTINYLNYSDNNQPNIESITINNMGELSKWPDGFFDQTQLDYITLFRLKKND